MRRLAAAMLGLAFACSPAWGTPDARARAEIEALLGAVERSGCTFVRGGVDYDGRAAREHLARKLGYAERRLSTADEFVEHVASASSVTGEAYRVRCGGELRDARSWMTQQLSRIRASGAPR